MHNTAFIALGSNLPYEDAEGPALLARAVSALQSAGLRLRAQSGVWRTAAWPSSDQPDYYNAVVAVDPGPLSPQALYDVLRAVEERFGRVRREAWSPRTLDLDIVAIDGVAGTLGGITLPHERMHERTFVLAPLAEIAPNWRHPTLGKSVAELLAGLGQTEGYRRIADLAGRLDREV